MENWVNKVAVITNIRCDIGIHLVEKLENLGLSVITLCNTDELNKITDELNSVSQNVVIGKLDGSYDKDPELQFKIEQQNGNPNVLINIISGDLDCTVSDGKLEDVKKMIDTNFSNAVAFIRLTASSIIDKQNRGHIINISDCQGASNKHLVKVTTAAISSVNEILRHEFRYLNANIKTTHMEIKSSERFDETPRNTVEVAKDVADMVINVLNTPENFQVHELWLDIAQK